MVRKVGGGLPDRLSRKKIVRVRSSPLSLADVLARIDIRHRQPLPLGACGYYQLEFFGRNSVAEVLNSPPRSVANLFE
jgi:hypothetical protein